MRSPALLLCASLLLLAIGPVHGLEPQETVGKALPDFKVELVSGTAPAAGRPTLLEFWATWCAPCRKTISHLNDLHSAWGKELQIIGVTDEERAEVEHFQRTQPMHYTVVRDPGGAFGKQMGVFGLPYAFLVDASGKVVWHGSPATISEETLETQLHLRAPATR